MKALTHTLHFIVLLVLTTASLAKEGTVFPREKLSFEEEGYICFFGDVILDTTTCMHRLVCDIADYDKYTRLESPGEAARHSASAETRRTQILSIKDQMLPDLEAILPPDRFAEAHASIVQFLKDTTATTELRQLEQRALQAYTICNRLKHSVVAGPDFPRQHLTEQVPAKLVFRPLGGPLIVDLLTGKWNVSISVPTPFGAITYSPGSTVIKQDGVKYLKVQVAGKARYFYLAHGFSLVLPPNLGSEMTVDGDLLILTINPPAATTAQANP